MLRLKFYFIFFLIFLTRNTIAFDSSLHCTSSERWAFQKQISSEYENHFNQMISGTQTPIEGFAHALSLRKNTNVYPQKVFAEYWISRAFYKAGLYHAAYTGFQNITQRPLQESTTQIQLAALECLSRINDEYPSFKISQEIIKPFFEFKRKSFIVAEALTKYYLDFPQSHIKGLEGAKHFLWLSEGMSALKNNQIENAINNFSQYLKTTNPLDHLPLFKRHNDFVHLSLAYIFYENKNFSNASYHFQKIPKNSNLLTKSLTAFAWSEFMQGNYGKSIGTTMQFNVGELRYTFAPEAFMILSMSLSEICQFPSALNAIQLFFDSYKDEYEWLKEWQKTEKPLYSLAIDSLKPTSKIPAKVSSEWIRTPLFLGRQEEINLIFKENKRIQELEFLGAKKQQAQAHKIIQDIRIILSEFNKIKSQQNLQTGIKFPEPLLLRIEKTKIELITYQRLKNAAPLWHQIATANKNRIESRRQNLVTQINTDLKYITQQMILDLNNISDNIQLIKMEIYNGATHDLVWQNANPDFKEVSIKIERSKKSNSNAPDVWDWGDLSGVLKGNEEVWEDELGAFQASMSNNCENKEKYLALKKEALILHRAPAQNN